MTGTGLADLGQRIDQYTAELQRERVQRLGQEAVPGSRCPRSGPGGSPGLWISLAEAASSVGQGCRDRGSVPAPGAAQGGTIVGRR